MPGWCWGLRFCSPWGGVAHRKGECARPLLGTPIFPIANPSKFPSSRKRKLFLELKIDPQVDPNTPWLIIWAYWPQKRRPLKKFRSRGCCKFCPNPLFIFFHRDLPSRPVIGLQGWGGWAVKRKNLYLSAGVGCHFWFGGLNVKLPQLVCSPETQVSRTNMIKIQM